MRSSRARALAGLSALAIALGAVAAGAQGRVRVAVLPVVVHAMDQEPYLRDGLADMLASRLGQQPGIAVIRVDEADQATNDGGAARASGRSAGAEWVLFGSFTRFGEGASLDLRCVPVAGDGPTDPRHIFVQAGQLAEIIPRLSGVAERVAAEVRGGAGDAASVAATPTPSDKAAPGNELEELRRRVEKLEGRVFQAPARDLSATGFPEAPQ